MIVSLYEFIDFQARLNPAATAVDSAARTATYAQLCHDVEQLTRVLHHAEGVLPDTRVAVYVRDPYLHWCAVLALMRIGAASVSVSDRTRELAFVGAPVVVSDEALPAPYKCILLSADSFKGAALAPFVDAPHPDERLCRIVLSSGTTGTPKKVGITYAQMYERARGAVRIHGLNSTARVLSTMGIQTMGGFAMPLFAWTGGGAALLAPFAGKLPGEQFVAASPNVVLTSPAQLAGTLETLPAGHWPREHMEVFVTGGVLPAPLAERARLKLTQALYVLYGSTEMGTVALAHASAGEGVHGFAGYVLPPGPIEVIDEGGRVLPRGETGELRMRQHGMAQAYLDDAPDASFRDGWFYPGDLGSIDTNGALIVQGRKGEMMNVAGSKIAPDVIEQALWGFEGTRDLAVFSVPHEAGADRLWLAVVPRDDFQAETLVQKYRESFAHLPPITIARIDAIPRNAMGKVLRQALSDTVREAIAQGAKPREASGS